MSLLHHQPSAHSMVASAQRQVRSGAHPRPGSRPNIMPLVRSRPCLQAPDPVGGSGSASALKPPVCSWDPRLQCAKLTAYVSAGTRLGAGCHCSGVHKVDSQWSSPWQFKQPIQKFRQQMIN
jgi:hypothetical protein